MAQHARFGFDATNSPADNANAINHGGVAIGADDAIGIGDTAFVVNATGEILQIDLVHDADAGRNDLEGIEGLHAPLHELITLFVSLKFKLHVEVKGLF